MLFFEGPPSTVTAVEFFSESSKLAFGLKDGTLAAADLFAGTWARLGQFPDLPVTCICRNDHNSSMIFAGPSGWYIFEPIGPNHWGIQFSPQLGFAVKTLAMLDEKTLAIGSGDAIQGTPGLLMLHNLLTGKRLEPSFREASEVRALAVHPSSYRVAWTNAKNRLSIWNTHTIEPQQIGLSHSSPSLAFHPNGERLFLALEWQIKCYDVESRQERATWKGHTGRVTAVACSPNGKIVATGSWDRTVRLWDPETGANLATLDWGIGRVSCLAFAQDGSQLAAGGENGKVAVCDVD